MAAIDTKEINNVVNIILFRKFCLLKFSVIIVRSMSLLFLFSILNNVFYSKIIGKNTDLYIACKSPT